MKIIGITGGVGAGKSTVLSTLKELTNCDLVMSDDEAKKLMQKEGPLSDAAIRLFGEKAYLNTGNLNTAHIAELMYNNPLMKKEWENIVHPAVNNHIKKLIRQAEERGRDFIFIESALLIENNYDKICDELWYVFATREDRRARLKTDRGYSDEKIDSIFRAQLSEEEFMKACSFIIDTSGTVEDTRSIIKNKLEEYPVL